MSCSRQDFHRPRNIFLLDQNVIGIKRRNGKNWDPGLRQRIKESRQHACQRKGKWPFQFQRDPAFFATHIVRHPLFPAYNRELVTRANKREERCFQRPLRNGRISPQAANRKALRQKPEFQ